MDTAVEPSAAVIQVPAVLAQLRFVRYALMAGWIALAIAHPTLLMELPWLAVGLLSAVVIVAGFVPLSGDSEA